MSGWDCESILILNPHIIIPKDNIQNAKGKKKMRIFKETFINETGIQRLCLPFDTLEEAKKSILKIDMQGKYLACGLMLQRKRKKSLH